MRVQRGREENVVGRDKKGGNNTNAAVNVAGNVCRNSKCRVGDRCFCR